MINLKENIKQEKEKLQKGCEILMQGKCVNLFGNTPFECNCGNIIKKVLFLCPICKAKLQTLSDIEAQIKEKVGELKKDIPEDYSSKEFENRIDKIMGDFE
jgi:gas vesicle protein